MAGALKARMWAGTSYKLFAPHCQQANEVVVT